MIPPKAFASEDEVVLCVCGCGGGVGYALCGETLCMIVRAKAGGLKEEEAALKVQREG